jgi:TPR repeat protein
MSAVQGLAPARCYFHQQYIYTMYYIMYERGEGVEEDAVQAVHLYRKAACQECAGCSSSYSSVD